MQLEATLAETTISMFLISRPQILQNNRVGGDYCQIIYYANEPVQSVFI